MKATISTELKLQSLIGALRQAWKEHRYLKVSYSVEKDRSASQNALSHVWYEQISRELAEDTPEGVKCECKLRYGVPILRADDDEFRAAYDSAIRETLTYEQKLDAMRILPVTSLMNVSQLSQYLETLQREFARCGVQLEFPDEVRAAS